MPHRRRRVELAEERVLDDQANPGSAGSARREECPAAGRRSPGRALALQPVGLGEHQELPVPQELPDELILGHVPVALPREECLGVPARPVEVPSERGEQRRQRRRCSRRRTGRGAGAGARRARRRSSRRSSNGEGSAARDVRRRRGTGGASPQPRGRGRGGKGGKVREVVHAERRRRKGGRRSSRPRRRGSSGRSSRNAAPWRGVSAGDARSRH